MTPELVADSPEMNPLAKLALQLGVPAAIAVYLVWIISGSLIQEVRANTIVLQQHTLVTESIKASLGEQQGTQNVLVNLMQQMCVNSSRTTAERNACFEARRK